LFSRAFRPKVGKLANPHSSPPVKNHWKKPHKKLNEKNLPNAFTCFLQLLNKKSKRIIRFRTLCCVANIVSGSRLSPYFASLAPFGVWKLLMRWAVAVPLGYVSLKSIIIICSVGK